MASPPLLMTLGPALLIAIDGKGQGKERRRFSLVCATTTQTRGKASSPTLSSLGQLTCTPQIQGQLYCAAHVRGGACSL